MSEKGTVKDIYDEKSNSAVEDVLTFEEAMDVLHVKKTTMYKLMQQPDHPQFVKLGTKKIITRKSLIDWIEKREGCIIF